MKKLLLLCVIFISYAGFSNNEETLKNSEKIVTKVADSILSKSSKGVNVLYDDIKDGTSTIYTDIKNGAYPEVKNGLNILAKELKTSVNNVWDIIVKQQIIYSIAYLILFITSLFLWFKFSKAFIICKSELDENGKSIPDNVLLCIVLGSLAVVNSIISGYHVVPMLTGFFNPEYGALETIIQTSKHIIVK